MSIAPPLLLLSAALYVSGAIFALLEPRVKRLTGVTYLLPAAAGLAGIGAGLAAMSEPGPTIVSYAGSLPYVSVTLRLDGLSGFFLTLASLGAVTSSLFASPYLAKAGISDRGSIAFSYNLFLFALSGVFLANDIYTFLVLWELMSLASFLLVLSGRPAEEARAAANTYLVMMHVATALVIASFLLLYSHTGSGSFEGFRAAAGLMPADLRDWVFFLALAGFGMKAGIVPLHVWLPKAHPAAPSHVSALMSGVMITAGIYMIIRVAFEYAGPPQGHWGIVLIVLGAIGAVLGALQALASSDIKKALAYSTVEHSGLIMLTLGVSLFAAAGGNGLFAAFALAAALFHAGNHMVFKSLMFLGVGCVVEAVHSRDLEMLGGLARRMPRTAALCLVGAGALAALPPLSGFASEWTIFQSVLALLVANDGPVAAGVATALAMAVALAGGLAVAGSLRIFGLAFLGKGRSPKALQATDADWRMAAPLLPLAALCVVVGILAPLVFDQMFVVATPLTLPQAAPRNAFMLDGAAPGMSSMWPLGITALLAWGFLIALVALRTFRRRRTKGPTWAGGEEKPGPRFAISATAYAAAATQIFPTFFKVDEKVERSATREEGRRPITYSSAVDDPVEQSGYRPVPLILEAASKRLRWIQSGSIHQYMVYLLAAMILAVGAMRWL
jgi:hydrogenase-4 component B